MPSQVNVRVLYWIFALSGFSGLIYESIWSRYLGLFLGHAAYAQTLVLVIFMGGMASGAWLCSRWSLGWSNLLRGYAAVEGIIGVLALVFHESFTAFLAFFFDSIIPQIASPASVTTIKWASAAVLILPQSSLLGMTFPLMSGGIIRRYPDRPGSTLAMLYFSNSIGGVLGVLASGFLLIRLVGLPGTIRTAGIINIVLALLVWRFGKASEQPFAALPVERGAKNENRNDYWILLLVAFLTGTASFIYEIAWIRMLSMVLGSSTHSFELMLSAFILGLALGGLWIRSRIDRIADPMRFLALVQVVMGILALSTLLVYASTFNVMQWLLNVTPKTDLGYLLFNLSSHGVAMAVMLPTTFCAGMTLPLITYVLLRKGLGERSIGIVYSANTLGAIVGIVFAVHFGMPVLGLKNLMVWGATTDISLGLLLLGTLYRASEMRPMIAASAAGIIAIVATLGWVHLDPYRMASGVFRRAQSRLDFSGGDLVLSHADGKTATVSIVWKSTGLSIRTNGKIDATLNRDPAREPTSDEATMVLSGALPILLHPGAKTAANIGMGSGLTSQVLLSTPSLAQVDTVEIEQAMVDAARHFRPRNDLVFNDPRSRVYIEDAKTFFSTHWRKYDIIVSEPSNPWVSGVAGLFSVEFYNLITRHLNEHGVLVQWLQLYEIDIDLIVSVLKALSKNFGDYQIYAANDGDIIIVARLGLNLSRPNFSAFDRNGRFAAELQRVGIVSDHDVEIRRVGDKRLLQDWLDSTSVHANSDYFPKLDLGAERTRFLDLNASELLFLRQAPLPLLAMIGRPSYFESGAIIMPDRKFKFSQRLFAATRLRDHVLGRAKPGVPPVAAATEQEIVRTIQRCISNQTNGDRISTLFKIGFEVVPYLGVNELEMFWKRFDKFACAANIQKDNSEWLELFKAVGRHDATAMGRIAENILTRPGSDRYADYLLAVAMLANRALGNDSQVQSLWIRHRPRHLSSEWSLLFDVIRAIRRRADS